MPYPAARDGGLAAAPSLGRHHSAEQERVESWSQSRAQKKIRAPAMSEAGGWARWEAVCARACALHACARVRPDMCVPTCMRTCERVEMHACACAYARALPARSST